MSYYDEDGPADDDTYVDEDERWEPSDVDTWEENEVANDREGDDEPDWAGHTGDDFEDGSGGGGWGEPNMYDD